jgi:SAM-dependent methyltransferase
MDPRERFSSRVENYIKYRPGYPPGVIETLRDECALTPGSIVADIGSGTGLLARLFLDYGCHVYGVEPNPEMRAAGERLLADYRLFTAVDGSAESTGLPAASMDFITAGQAFHWFIPQLARKEFMRILKPSGWAALVWNERRLDSTPFLRAYENLLQTYATDYNIINHRTVEANPETIPAFFGGDYQVSRFDNVQMLNFAGVRGRLESSSYIPEPGHPNYERMLADLRKIYVQHQQDGMVSIEYDTRMFYGRISR